MSIDLENIKLLQKFDKEIYDLQQEQKRIPLDIKEFDDIVVAQKAVVAEAEEKVKSVKLGLHEKELALQEKEEQIKKYEAQLSQVKTNKEYTALQKEIKNIQADNSILEEDILKAMDGVQAVEAGVKKERDLLQEKEGERAVKNKDLDELLKKNEGVVGELSVKRKAASANIDVELLTIYEKILNAKDGVALAPVINNSCGVCRMSLLAQTINEVMMGEKVVFCRSCHRILYLEKKTEDVQ